MASQKERQRWERWYDQVTARIDRQKAALTRFVNMATVSNTALIRIAQDPDVKNIKQARAIAEEALAAIKDVAAAEAENVEAIEAATPVEDPRSNH